MYKEINSSSENSIINSINRYKEDFRKLGLDVDNPQNGSDWFVVRFNNIKNNIMALLKAGNSIYNEYKTFYINNANRNRINLNPVKSTNRETDFSIWNDAIKAVVQRIKTLHDSKELEQAKKDLENLKDPNSDLVFMVITFARIAGYKDNLLDPNKYDEFYYYVNQIDRFKDSIQSEFKELEKLISMYKKDKTKPNKKAHH